MPFARRKLSMIMALRKAGVIDLNVLNAMEAVDRSAFVPVHMQDRAWELTTLPIGHGQTLSAPEVVGLMTQALELKKTDKVLEIGTGSGYQTQILSRLCRRVYTIERHQPLMERAKRLLTKLGTRNVEFSYGDGFEGWPDKAPFDAIIITAAPSDVPTRLATQLSSDSRLVLPLGEQGGSQKLIRVSRKNDRFDESYICDVNFVPMLRGLPQES
jgi:protein-L-isoaspartate(D-aspartate) O-methyltransferase